MTRSSDTDTRGANLRSAGPLAAGFAVVLLAASLASACNVPVFRYALEHWHPDDYRGVVFHRGGLTDADRALIATPARPSAATSAATRANITFRTVDVDAIDDPADRALLESSPHQELPCVVVQYPASLRLDHAVWSGPLGAAPLAALVDSPVRREILKRLANGQTAVWLLLETGDEAKDAPALALLEEELKKLQRSLELPELTDAPEDVLMDGPALRIEFSLLQVRRDDPAEQPLVAQLLAAEADLHDLDEPMVFPVFGRGRALLPLIGAGIIPDNVRSSASFLAGACSCQVKELNPGFDLLASAEWEELISWAKSPEFAMGEKVDERAEPELVPIPRGSADSPAAVASAADGSHADSSYTSPDTSAASGTSLASDSMVAKAAAPPSSTPDGAPRDTPPPAVLLAQARSYMIPPLYILGGCLFALVGLAFIILRRRS